VILTATASEGDFERELTAIHWRSWHVRGCSGWPVCQGSVLFLLFYFQFFQRGLTPVKAFNRRLFGAFVIVGMLGFAGCGPDNETEGSKLATKAGDPGKPAEGSIPKEKTTSPANDKERAARGPQGTINQFQKGGGTAPAK